MDHLSLCFLSIILSSSFPLHQKYSVWRTVLYITSSSLDVWMGCIVTCYTQEMLFVDRSSNSKQYPPPPNRRWGKELNRFSCIPIINHHMMKIYVLPTFFVTGCWFLPDPCTKYSLTDCLKHIRVYISCQEMTFRPYDSFCHIFPWSPVDILCRSLPSVHNLTCD